MTLNALAVEAASHWNGEIIRLIRNRENAVFEVALQGERAALRLHRQGYQNDAAIQSELWWCAALAKSGVAVPAALPNSRGEYLVRLSNGRNASMISWAEGEALGESGQPFGRPLDQVLDQHRALGALIADFHSATDQLSLPPDFTRPSWDIGGLVGETPFWGRFWEHPAAKPEQAETLNQARDFLLRNLTQHADNNGDFGLIHADILRENVLVNKSSLSLIDFDDSGFGFRLYDLGTVLSQNLYEPAYPLIRDALIAGYAKTKAASVEMVEIFTLARTCASVGWTAPRLKPDDPINQSHIARAVMWAKRVMG